MTLIGCIAADDEFVEPSYIIPSPLLNKKKVEDYCLRKVKTFVQQSGYMTGPIFARWIGEVLIPYVNNERKNIEQHALLICDAHSSHMNEDVLSLLRSNNIDMVILPAHSTSVFQPLDRDLYDPYKNSFRELYKEGDLYSLLYTSRTSFLKTITPMKIKSMERISTVRNKYRSYS